MAGQGAWNDPACYPENREPTPVDPNERCPFGPPKGGGEGDCTDDPSTEATNFSSTQDPNPGEVVETKEKYKVNQTKNPEPKCSGSCDCSPGEVKIQNNETKGTGKKETAKIKLELKNATLYCKCASKSGPVTWYQKCSDTTIDIEAEAEVMEQTWDEVYDVSCSCTDEKGCGCTDNYTVTTTYAREFYYCPSADRPKEIPGCECDGNAPKDKKQDCPEPCKPVSHNYGPKCDGCGGSHGG